MPNILQLLIDCFPLHLLLQWLSKCSRLWESHRRRGKRLWIQILLYLFTDWSERRAFTNPRNSLNPAALLPAGQKNVTFRMTRASQQPSQRIRISIFQGGDRVICIHLMSIPPGSKKRGEMDTCRSRLTLFKSLFPTFLWQHWPLHADKALLHR